MTRAMNLVLIWVWLVNALALVALFGWQRWGWVGSAFLLTAAASLNRGGTHNRGGRST